MAGAAGILEGLQRQLETIYGLESPLRASAFLVDRAQWQAHSSSAAPEELLVVERDDGLEIGLFVDEHVTSVLAASDGRWTAARLAAHCQAIEGVSHFLYLTHRARLPRPVSQLELELQAEIDKFASVVLHLWDDGRREAAKALIERLFERVSYRADLTAEQRARYEKANFLARLYCRFLDGRYLVRGRIDALLADLRRMYRLGAGEKLSYAARGAAL